MGRVMISDFTFDIALGENCVPPGLLVHGKKKQWLTFCVVVVFYPLTHSLTRLSPRFLCFLLPLGDDMWL